MLARLRHHSRKKNGEKSDRMAVYLRCAWCTDGTYAAHARILCSLLSTDSDASITMSALSSVISRTNNANERSKASVGSLHRLLALFALLVHELNDKLMESVRRFSPCLSIALFETEAKDGSAADIGRYYSRLKRTETAFKELSISSEEAKSLVLEHLIVRELPESPPSVHRWVRQSGPSLPSLGAAWSGRLDRLVSSTFVQDVANSCCPTKAKHFACTRFCTHPGLRACINFVALYHSESSHASRHRS